MLRGLTTVSFHAEDVAAAARWYAELLGAEPYFSREVGEQLAYVEFRLGDYQHELGIIGSDFAPHPRPARPGGAVTYWHVDGVRAAFERLLSMGATVYEEPVERGPGFVTASVVDPFGNVLGIMHNRHYLEVLGR
ncbi:VOC family protein [Streptomyces sp. NPDC012888]|uniref:VOC family protein n=1 Tax=Streptomyces sp. NPDC012888 TaxID=3364855 RepID=UPI0036B021E9